MDLRSTDVGLLACPLYDRAMVKDRVESLCKTLDLQVSFGSRVLLKPNLVIGGRNNGLPCTHPEFVAAVAEWFVDQGARVKVGDSPAFGQAKGVMATCGITEALKGLPVEPVNFSSVRQVVLDCGVSVGIAQEALECDLLVNLPKVKAHSQLFITLAVKNYFGTVVGFQKPWLHARYGDVDNRFEALLVDLLAVLPGGISLVDGIVAMHEEGPTNGKALPLSVIGGSFNPVAMDTALLAILKLSPQDSPLWCECDHRKLVGTSSAGLVFSLCTPEQLAVDGFRAPARLKPVTFHPWRLFVGAIKRIIASSDT